jgi:SagB-type dehydrogenase family enzyme
MSLVATLAARRTIRELSADRLRPDELGQLLWAAQGISHDGIRRTAPSASALYALEAYAATPDGLFHYAPGAHALGRRGDRDLRRALQAASGDQPFMGSAPLIVILCVVIARLTSRHGPERAVRYADFEAGHAGQNLLLQATALGLAGVPVGSFSDDEVRQVLGLPADESPRYLFAIGRLR